MPPKSPPPSNSLARARCSIRPICRCSPPEDQGSPLPRTDLEDWIFTFDYADRTLRDHFHLLSLDGCGLANRQAAVCAAGAILHYLRETQRAALEHLDRPTHYDRAESMLLDAVTVRNLELVEPLFAGERTDATLLHVLDQTGTGMGGRLLRQRLLRPSLDRAEIEGRLDAAGELLQQTILRAELRKQLSGILDIERLLAKITMGVANPRDVLALGRSLEKIPSLKAAFETQRAARLRDLHGRLDDVAEARDRILQAIADEPPINLADGGTIRAGFHADLDELRDLSRNGRQVIAQIEARERARTGIQSLKVRFNNVFGYYIEISKANQHLAPADYERKQTLVNAERFTTPELKDYERKVLDAEDKILTLEKELFAEVRKFAAAHAQRIRATAAAIAEIDVTAALAQVAAENRYVRPTFSEDGEMRILAGRHPVIERLEQQDAGRFIPNDLYLNSDTDLIAIITGPNMGGKSTYLRQAALIAILAQMGSFVPADSAILPLTDRIFTRIGASDNLARGRSTFMVEMTETAVILNTATPRSFIVLDEIGRGTATYDGLALAWAVVEHIHARTRAKTLFATHYHELTELAGQLDGIRNLSVSVKEAGDRIIFLRKVEPGKADRSYGIGAVEEVAREEAGEKFLDQILTRLPRRRIPRSSEGRRKKRDQYVAQRDAMASRQSARFGSPAASTRVQRVVGISASGRLASTWSFQSRVSRGSGVVWLPRFTILFGKRAGRLQKFRSMKDITDAGRDWPLAHVVSTCNRTGMLPGPPSPSR